MVIFPAGPDTDSLISVTAEKPDCGIERRKNTTSAASSLLSQKNYDEIAANVQVEEPEQLTHVVLHVSILVLILLAKMVAKDLVVLIWK